MNESETVAAGMICLTPEVGDQFLKSVMQHDLLNDEMNTNEFSTSPNLNPCDATKEKSLGRNGKAVEEAVSARFSNKLDQAVVLLSSQLEK